MGGSGWQADDLLRALLALVRHAPPEDLARSPIARLADSGFRADLLDLSARHRVHGRIVLRLASLDPRPAVPDGWMEELAGLLLTLRTRSAAFDLKRERALKPLERGGVRAITLKGAGTALTLYDDPVERDLRDLDLLVRKADLARSVAILEAAGYRRPESRAVVQGYEREHFHLPLRDRDGHLVEVHWELAFPLGPFRLSSDEIRDRARPVGAAGGFLIPCYEHQLLHVVLQNIQEGFSHLGRIVEIDRIARRVEGLDWQLATDTARRGGIAVPLAVSLQLARRLLATPLDAEVLRLAGAGRVARLHIAFLRPEEHLLRQLSQRRFGASRLLELWTVGGAAGRLHHLLRVVSEDTGDWLGRERRTIGVVERLRRLGGILARQAAAYATAARMIASPSGRGELRAWAGSASWEEG